MNVQIKKLKSVRSNMRSGLLRSSTIGLIIQMTDNFALALGPNNHTTGTGIKA